MMKLAIVGLGIIGMSHLNAVQNSTDFELCAVCDLNEEKAEAIAERLKVPCFTDYHAIPEQVFPDAVILNLPHFLHCEATVFFLRKGVNVLVEKPMANTVAECDQMLAAAEQSGKKLAVGHIQRFFRANSTVKEIVSSGRLGKLVMVEEMRTINYFAPQRPAWFKSKKTAGGGIVMNYGAHALDKLFYITGHRAAEIFASCGNLKNDGDIEGHAQIMMRFLDGLSATVTFSGYLTCGYSVIYHFTDGALRVVGSTDLSSFEDGEWKPVEVQEDNLFMERQLKEFGRYLAGEAADIADGKYGRDVLRAIEQIYASGDR